MKVAIVNNMAPFIYGGAEFLADSLVEKLMEYGHEAQVIRLPFAWDTPQKILDSMMAVKLTKLMNVDKVIALKFPAYYIEHPNKTFWLIHQFRQVYDLADAQNDLITKDEVAKKIKDAIVQADNQCFSNIAGTIYTISDVITERIKKYNGFNAKTLPPPLMDAEMFYCGECGDYVFYPSRVNNAKRQYLAVEAMRYVKSGVKLLLVGKGDSTEDEEHIFRMIEEYGLKDKVTYLNRFITQQEKADFFAEALCGLFIPFNEDYGFVTLESFYAGKALITCSDSGCPPLFVREGEAGVVVEPQPEALALAMDEMFINKRRTIEMGKNGLPLIERFGITWDNTIRSLIK